nr:hypothetical protein GCM10020092_034260 [Actinoplanes digitatis]
MGQHACRPAAPPVPEPPADDGLLSGPAFFLSYARAKPAAVGERGDPNSGVMKLFADLNDRVRQLLPLQVGDDAGWMDVTMEVERPVERRVAAQPGQGPGVRRTALVAVPPAQ